MDQKDKAVEILKDALEQARKFYRGKPHLTLAEILINLGVSLQSAQNAHKCLQYFQEAQELMDEILGPNHTHSLSWEILQSMAQSYYDLDDLAKAQQYLQDALNMNSVICAENGVNDRVATLCSNMAVASEKMGNLSQAKEYFCKAVKIRNKLISSNKNTDFDLFGNLYKLSMISEALGEDDEAFKLLQEAKEIEEAVGSKNWKIYDVLLKVNTQFGIGSFAKVLTRLQGGMQVAKNMAEENCPPESLKYLEILKQI